jgi:hypothetical protein
MFCWIDLGRFSLFVSCKSHAEFLAEERTRFGLRPALHPKTCVTKWLRKSQRPNKRSLFGGHVERS